MKMLIVIKKLWTQLRARALVWDTITTTGWSAIGKGAGFLVPFFIAAWFGVTAETDAFFFAYGIILFFSTIFAPVVESIIVPYVAEARSKNENVGNFIGKVLGVCSLGLAILIVVVILIIKPLLSLVTRFDQQSLDLIYQILIRTAPLIILLVWTSILSGTLNAYKKFSVPAFSPCFRAICNIGLIFMFKDKLGVHAIALGYVAGEVVRVVILLAYMMKCRLFRLTLTFDIDSKVKEFFKTASYQVVGMVALSLSPIIDAVMASWLGSGNVSILYYAGRLYQIPLTFFGTGLTIAMLSHWSARYQVFGRERLYTDVKTMSHKVFLIVAPVVFLFIIFSMPIVTFIFGRGNFPTDELVVVSRVLIFYLIGAIFYIPKQIFVKGHTVLKNTKVLMKCAFFATFLNIIFNYILMKLLNVEGIALATTLVSIFSLLYLRKKFYTTHMHIT